MPACEMCGREAPLRLATVEGTRMSVCPSCLKFGTEVPGQPSGAPRPGAPAGIPGGAGPRPAGQRDIFAASEVEVVEDFAKRIREGRQRKGLTQEELARKLNERQSILSKVEAGTQRPGDDLARRLERELGIQLFERAAQETVAERRPVAGALTLGDLIKRESDRK